MAHDPRSSTPNARVASARIRQADGVRATWCGDELVLLDTRSDTYYSLNRVAGRLWDLLLSPRTAAELVRFVRAAYDVGPTMDTDVLEQDVLSLLRDLTTAGLAVAAAPNAVDQRITRTPVAG